MSDTIIKNILRLYILEDTETKSLLEYTGYEMCSLFNQIIHITTEFINIDLLIGKEYGLVECTLDQYELLLNNVIQIYPSPTAKNNWPTPVFIRFVEHPENSFFQN